MANVLYDFNAGGVIVPYIGAGAGVAFVDASALGLDRQHAVRVPGASWVSATTSTRLFRVNLDARYYGTTSPSFGGNTCSNNNISVMLSLQVKFGAPSRRRRRRRPRRWPRRRRSWCSSIGTARTCRSRR